jgi:hypothetical protein
MTMKRSAAVVIAVTLQRLAEGTGAGWSFEQQLVLDALRRSTSALKRATDEELGNYIRCLSENELRGVVSNVKGIFHELLFVHAENTDDDAMSAQLFDATNHPGADVEFIVDEQSICAVQLKAVSSPEAVLVHLKTYPDIEIYATTEIASTIDQVEDSGFFNADLTQEVQTTLENLSHGGLRETFIETMATSSLVSSALLASSVLKEGRLSKTDFASALRNAGVGTAAAMSIDALISFMP